MTIIGKKWVYRNKLDENGVVTRNKARLVAQGYNQEEGIDYDETYAPVARLESIRILLAYACALDFKLYQMDVKSAFLNSFINEEVYVVQPLRFIDFAKPNYVYRLKKALYGLKQALKAWYDRLKAFLIKHDYSMGMVEFNTAITGPEYPPSPEFVPEPVYSEFMPPEDEILLAEEQPLPAADSPGYILESDPEEDPEEDDDEDPEEDPADYPADGGDDGDDRDEPSDDDEDEEVDIEAYNKEEEEEEHPAPTDSTVVALPALVTYLS
ncbi:copia protein [Tanacetum coccineum]